METIMINQSYNNKGVESRQVLLLIIKILG